MVLYMARQTLGFGIFWAHGRRKRNMHSSGQAWMGGRTAQAPVQCLSVTTYLLHTHHTHTHTHFTPHPHTHTHTHTAHTTHLPHPTAPHTPHTPLPLPHTTHHYSLIHRISPPSLTCAFPLLSATPFARCTALPYKSYGWCRFTACDTCCTYRAHLARTLTLSRIRRQLLAWRQRPGTGERLVVYSAA